MNVTALLIIVIVLGVVIGNIMLLKHTAKMPMKKVTLDPMEKAKAQHQQNKDVSKSEQTTTKSDSDKSQ